MPKKTGIAIVAVGAVLILSALLLFLHNRQEDVQAGQEAESLLENVEAVIEMKTIKVRLSVRSRTQLRLRRRLTHKCRS